LDEMEAIGRWPHEMPRRQTRCDDWYCTSTDTTRWMPAARMMNMPNYEHEAPNSHRRALCIIISYMFSYWKKRSTNGSGRMLAPVSQAGYRMAWSGSHSITSPYQTSYTDTRRRRRSSVVVLRSSIDTYSSTHVPSSPCPPSRSTIAAR
jgi:hypothetical protein